MSDVLYLRPENKSLQEARDGKTPWGAVSVLALVFGSTYGLINLVVLLSQIQREKILNAARKALREILAGVVCGAVVGLLLVVFLAKVIWPYLGYPQSPSLTVALGPPLVLLAFVVGAFAEIGILGRSLSEPEREYWSRIGAWSLIYAVIWLGVFGLTLGGQYAFYQAQDYFHTRAAVGWGSFASWFVATALGALAGRSRATGAGKASRLIEWFGALVPYIFIAGLAVFASVATTEFLGPEPWEKAPTRLVPQVWAVVNNLDMTRFLWLGGVCAMGILVLMLCVDVNLFSLHALYANRLVRCYLGASRYKSQWDQRKPKGASTGVQMPARVEDRMTGMDADDDLPLRLLTIGYESGGDGRVKPTTYWGPYLLINTALNMVSGAELAWQDRKAVSFVLSPRHCGSQTTGYATLCEDADEYLTLGRAMAISGAAASPNMGYHSSPGLTAVMAVFNMRLGWWIQNPNYNWGGSGPKTWQARGPGPGPWFMDELLGLTNDTSKFVYLSDGGHFENLGLYELVRRRCKYIIVCDASADPQYHFEDLAGAIRKCRTDFGVRIQIDVCNLPAKGRRKCHCVAGRIYYSDVHDGEQKEKHDGLLLYIKASLTGDEPADVRQYAASHPDFPHEATVDQFFSEAQFESYRALGYHVAGNMLGERRGEVGPHGDTIGHWDIPALFHDLYNEWVPLPGGTAEDFYKSVEQYLAVQDALRTDPKLTELSHELYSAVFEKLPGPTSPTELHMVLRLLQVMEIAFAQVGLDEYDDHAKKMGWVDVLQHWARSPTMQRYWPYIKGEFGLGFQRYFERISRAPSDREPHKARERD
ncbi:MAG TPA: hypothetical protein VG826_34655 [Pirellulales bacterium]|nr:hypothetical protein [Pirellulales bacterium]